MLSLLATLLIAQAPLTLHVESKFSLAGGEIGNNVYDETSDGYFKSISKLKIGQTSIDSDLSGRWSNGVPTDLKFVQRSGAVVATIVVKAGKVTVDSGKTHHESPFNFKGKLFFSNFHPQLVRGVGDFYRADIGGKQKFSVFLMEGATALDVQVESIGTHTGQRAGHAETATGYEISFPGVAADFYTVGDRQVDGFEVKSQQFQCLDAGLSNFFVDPIAAYPELSQTTFKTKKVEAVSIPMRDGVKLVHDALMPEAPGKYPVILVRTPYGRKDQLPLGNFYAQRGYVYIVQDCRGREDSEGVWDPMVNERRDGYDTIEWIAKQPWCDGNVGMIGASYGGYVQWAAAVEHPAALKCIIPQVSPPDAFTNIPYEFGTLPLIADCWWLNIVRNKKTDMTGMGTLAPNPKGLMTLPLKDLPKATFGYDLPMFSTWLKRDRAADWNGFDIEKDVESVKIPVLNISGWWDGDGIGTELHWTKLRAAKKDNEWLIEGPWTHAFNTTTKLGEYDFGPGAILELDSIYLRWFDSWLKQKDAKLDTLPKATVFMTGENKWHRTSDFPEAGAVPATWFLSGGGKLLSTPGTGESKYTYDPHVAAEVATLPKPLQTDVSMKLNALIGKPGNVFFKSDPFAKATSLEGPITFKGFVRADVVDTDLFAIVADELPDGTILGTTQAGKLRLSYRNGFAKPELLKPGKTYEVTLLPWWFAHRFEKGHRLVLILCSSTFPGTARNLNTGEPILTGKRMVTAHVEILHDKAHPSSLNWFRLPD